MEIGTLSKPTQPYNADLGLDVTGPVQGLDPIQFR